MRLGQMMRFPPVPAATRLRRHHALADMVQHAVRAGSYAEPWDRTPRIWESYDTESDILRDLHQQWRTELAGSIFVAIERGNGDLCADVGAAYAEVIARLSGVKKILDAYAAHPAIAPALAKERALLTAASHAINAA
ncbi:MAG TPA: hypothetical protein VLI04_18940 [Nocardioidaceae bacterium]|nr:hypothetical protein [Nocardioidaceae bacterium]